MNYKIRKPVYAILLMIPLIAIFAAILLITNVIFWNQQSDAQNKRKIEGIEKTFKVLEDDRNKELERFKAKSKNIIDLMPVLLKPYISGYTYSGPEVFTDKYGLDGFVVQIKNNKVIYPSEPFFFPDLDKDFIERQELFEKMEITDDEGIKNNWHISSKKIEGNYYYVDIVHEDEIIETIIDTARLTTSLSEIEKSYNVLLFLIQTESEGNKSTQAGISSEGQDESGDYTEKTHDELDRLSFVYHSDEFGKDVTPNSLGITQEFLQERYSLLKIGDKSYRCDYTKVWAFWSNALVIILSDTDNDFFSISNNIVLSVFLTAIGAISMTLWLYWVQTYVQNHDLIPSQVPSYKPDRIRKMALGISLIGAMGVFLILLFYQSLSNLNREANANQIALKTIMNRLAEYKDAAIISERQKDEEEWAVYYAERIAEMISGSKTLWTHEALEEINKYTGSKFIILFDSEGNEIASSNDLVGYSFSNMEPLNGFQRLLAGADPVVLEPQEDPTLFQEVQYIGSKIRLNDGQSYGAVVLAIDPDNTWKAAEARSFNDFLENSTPEGNLVFIINKESSRVDFSSRLELVNDLIPELNDIADGPKSTDLDSWIIDGKRYYGPYDTVENSICFYLTDSSYIQFNSFAYSFLSALGFLLILFGVSQFMLKPYSSQIYKTLVKLRENHHQDAMIEMDSLDDFFSNKEDDFEKSLGSRWRDLIPEEKISLFIQVFLGIFLITAVILWSQRSRYSDYSTIGFILSGNWKRGLNLLGCAGALLIFFIFITFSFFKGILQRILCALLDPKGETICRLAFSLFQYIAVIAGIYFILGYLGFNPTMQITSVSILSLAISLGSQSLVADILAGVFIIFEGDFQVGDMIEIDGFRGIVQEIGVRSTKILGLEDNIKIINNQSVKNVLNTSRLNSWYTMDYKITSDQPLQDIEEMLNRELPEIGKKIPEIVSGPYYKGIWNVGVEAGTLKYTLNITCECDAKMSRRVRRKINHEIIELFDRYGYHLA